MLFIIIHQAYELWFKEMLHETDYVIRMLDEGDLTQARYKMKRILTVLKVLVHQVDILETMSPLEFLSFRDFLETASGFQSYQFRELEFLLGLKDKYHMQRFDSDTSIRTKLEQRFKEPSLWTAFLRYLKNAGYEIPSNLLEFPDDGSNRNSEEVRVALVDIYNHNPAIAQFCELLVDLDEGLQEWRYRHVKMVERTIGAKIGTGGSPGVKYLQKTLFKPLFPDLWEIRTSFNK
jgi:tryptophan 2,3-dioxygenase